MNITVEKAGEVCVVTIVGRGYSATHKRMGGYSKTKIEGKSPSRRVIREIMKELSNG